MKNKKVKESNEIMENYAEKYTKILPMSKFRDILGRWYGGEITGTKCRDMIVDTVRREMK